MKIVGSPYRESAGIATDAIFASLEDNNSEGRRRDGKGKGGKRERILERRRYNGREAGHELGLVKLPIASRYIESRTRCLTFDKKKGERNLSEFPSRLDWIQIHGKIRR